MLNIIFLFILFKVKEKINYLELTVVAVVQSYKEGNLSNSSVNNMNII